MTPAAAYAQDGYALVPALSSATELTALRALFADAFASTPPEDRMLEWDADERMIMERLRVPPRLSALLEGTALMTRGPAIAAACLGVPVDALTVLPVLILKPARGVRTQWHQHTGNPRPPFIAEDITLWMPLEDLAATDSALEVIPGSHREARLPHDERLCIDPSLVAPGRILACPMAAGDALFIHEQLVHGARANDSSVDRRAISLYCHTHRSVP